MNMRAAGGAMKPVVIAARIRWRYRKMPGARSLIGAVIILLIFGAGGARGVARSSIQRTKAPPQAAALGYTVHTFHSSFDPKLVDTADTRKPGFQWYRGQFFGFPATQPDTLTLNKGGGITLDGKPGASASINSASPAPGGWVGSAFGGGGYFEATLKFNPEDSISAVDKKAWPAWWSMSIEHMAGLPGQQWPGQPAGYAHFIEPDFFEYDVWSFSPHQWYGGAVHDWYGEWKKTCLDGFCNVSNAPGGGTNFGNFQVRTPVHTDFTRYHRFGFLWSPATAASKGYAVYYFDGKPTNDKVTWSLLTDQPPPPGKTSWTFGIIDQQHLVLVLGTGVNEPMTVKSVDVWQKWGAQNLVQR